MAKPSFFPFVDAGSTDHVGLGRAIGEHLRDRIRAQCDRVIQQMMQHATADMLTAMARWLRSEADRVFPQYIVEIDGMAAGAAVDRDRMLLTACEESAMTGLRERCTTVTFSTGTCRLLGHNEDWSPGYEECFYVVSARLPTGTAFLSLAYMGAPPGSSVAFNSHGIAFSGNSIIGQHRPGLAKNLILRSQIEARTLAEFEALAIRGPRALTNNTMGLDRSGRAVNLEMSLDSHVATHAAEGALAHTNHVLSSELRHLDQAERPCSRRRLETTNEMSRSAPLSRGLMEAILRSHTGWPHSVCLHADIDHYDEAQTVAAAIVDLDTMTLSVANGPPCGFEYVSFRLQ